MKDNFNSLKPADRLIVLNAMKKGLHAGIRKQLVARSYSRLKICLHNDEEFSPADIWDKMPDRTRDHFNHTAKYVAKIDDLIEKAKLELFPAKYATIKKPKNLKKGGKKEK